MLITSDKSIYNPQLNPQKTNLLNQQLNAFNLKMTPIKRAWAQAVMHYNQTSKQAYINRFVAYPEKDGRRTATGVEYTNRTNEDRYGPYTVIPIEKNKVDSYLREYQTRDYACNTKSIARDEDKFLVQYLQDQVFNTPEFRNANVSAFKDALLKKVGFLRPRLYDLSETQSQVTFSKDKKGNRKINYGTQVKSGKKGLTIEYVDVENVYVDPYAKDNQEVFISTPMTDIELIKLYPMMANYLRFDSSANSLIQFEKDMTDKYVADENSFSRVAKSQEALKNIHNLVKEELKNPDIGISNIKDIAENPDGTVCEYIKPQWLSNYRTGERFSEWYWRPEQIMDFTRNTSKPIPPGASTNLNPQGEGFSFLGESEQSFNMIWDNMYFGAAYNDAGTEYSYRSRTYRVNEYYNLPENRYVLYIDNYVLFDGLMFERVKEFPLQPIYFDKTDGDGLFGRSINDSLYATQIEANERATKGRIAVDISSTNFLQVNTDLLENPNEPIQADILTFIRTKNTITGEQATQPAIQQIGFQNQSLQLSLDMEKKWEGVAEQMFPTTDQINSQLSKEEREGMIRSRAMIPNYFLKLNAEQLSIFAYKVFAAKLLELEYFNSTEMPITLAPSKVRALIIRPNEEDIKMAKKQIMDQLTQVNQAMIQKEVIMLQQDPDFKNQLAQFTQERSKFYAQTIQSEKGQDIAKNQENGAEALQQEANKNLQQDMDGFTSQKAQEKVKPMIDENMYLSIEQLGNYLSQQKLFTFSFKETKEETQRNLSNLLGTLGQLPLSGYTIDYNQFMKEILVAHGFNPDIRMKEVAEPSQLAAMQSTKYTVYLDGQKNPMMADALLETKFGLTAEQLQFNPNSPTLQGLQAVKDIETNSETQLQNAKASAQSQSKLAITAFQKHADSISTAQQQQAEATNQANEDTNPSGNPNFNPMKD